jgi:hypothetical protein
MHNNNNNNNYYYYYKPSWGVKDGRRVRLTTISSSLSRLSRQCENLDVSQPYGPSWPVTGLALPLPYLYYYYYWTPRSWVLLENPPDSVLFQTFMEPKDSLPYSQELSTGPYTNRMNPVHTTPSNFSRNHFNITLPPTSRSSTATIIAVSKVKLSL